MKVLQTESRREYVVEGGCYLRSVLSMAEDEAGWELTGIQIDEIADELLRTGKIDAQCTMHAEDSYSSAFRLAFESLRVDGITGNWVGMTSRVDGAAQVKLWHGEKFWRHSALCWPARDGSGDHWTHGDALLQQVWDPYGWKGHRVGLKRASLFSFWRAA